MVELNEEKLKHLMESRFCYLSPRNVLQLMPRYYPNARRNDQKTSSMMLSTYVYIVRNHLGDNDSSEYTYKDIAIQLGVKTFQSAYRYIQMHRLYWEKSPKYRFKFLLMLNDMQKLDKRAYNRMITKLNKDNGEE